MSDDNLDNYEGYNDWLDEFNAAGEADMLDEMAYRHDREMNRDDQEVRIHQFELANGYLDDKDDNPERELY